MNDFPAEFHLVSHELFLTNSCLCFGLTNLKNANLGDKKGDFYGGFFNCATALERLMKLILMFDYVLENELRFPDSNRVRQFSHDLISLFDAVADIASKYDECIDPRPDENSLEHKMVEFFNSFARGARYYNLDSLSGNSRYTDPLSEWETILKEVFNSDVSKRKKTSILASVELLEPLLRENSVIMHHDLSSNLLDTSSFVAVPQMIDSASAYAVVRFIVIVSSLVQILNVVSDFIHQKSHQAGLGVPILPYTHDFFYWLENERSYHLRKRRWP